MNNLNSLSFKEWMSFNTLMEEIGIFSSLSEFCSNFLLSLKKLIPFANGHFIFYDQNNKLMPLSFRVNINEKTHNEYLQYYHNIDDFFYKCFNTPYPKKSSSIMDYSKWKETEFFIDFQKKNHFYYVATADIHYKNKIIGTISLVRDKKSPDFSMKELLFLRLLTPHVANILNKLMIIEELKQKNTHSIHQIISENEKELNLTNRESEILHLALKGMSNREISDRLFISSETVKRHLSNLFKKSNVNSRMELLAKLLDIY